MQLGLGAAAGMIADGTDVDLARAALGAAVRLGKHKRNGDTVAAFKEALLSARAVAVPASASGIYLTRDLFPRLGIADKLNIKITARGTQAAALVAAGNADIAVQRVSGLVREPRLDFLGLIPTELQLIQTFSAAVVAGSKELDLRTPGGERGSLRHDTSEARAMNQPPGARGR